MMDADNASMPESAKAGATDSGTEGRPAAVSKPIVSLVTRDAGSREASVPQLVGGDKACRLAVAMEGVVARAVKYGHTCALLVPQSLIPEHVREDVLEVKVARVAEPEKTYVLYTTHLPGYKRAYLDLFQLGASYREELTILSVRKYPAEQFASGYDAAKPKGLENTELLWNGRFAMRVDGIRVELVGGRFRTYQGQVVLDAELGDGGLVKIAKSLEGFAMRLKDHSPVTSVRIRNGSIVMTYSRTDHDAYPHRRQVAAGRAPKVQPPLAGSAFKFAIHGPWRNAEGVFVVKTDNQTIALVSARLDSTTTLDEFRKVKGDIGEEMVRQVLPEVGMTLVADHPFNRNSWLVGSERIGPDLLVRMSSLDRLYYVEVKWWGKPDQAYADAEAQVLEDWRKYPDFEGEVISGCFAAIVNWKAEDDEILLQIVKVSSNGR